MVTKRDPQIERRLRPLYDALDNLNNKQALQRADKILKKEKDFHCAKVLKSLALVRLKRGPEAVAILDEVKQFLPLDECTLQAMTVCYKELLQPEGIPALYESALEHSPNSEDYMTQLFMAYVRIQDYKKQQQIATKLHRLTATTAYSFWNVMSLVLMGKDNPQLGKVMCFPLALKMIEKTREKTKQLPEEVFRLYIEVLAEMGSNEKALEELLSEAGDSIVDPRERLRLKLHFYAKQGNKQQLNILYKQNILEEPDCWEFYQGYFDTAFALLSDCAATNDTAANDTAANDTAANDTAANDTNGNDTAANDADSNDTASNNTVTNDTASPHIEGKDVDIESADDSVGKMTSLLLKASANTGRAVRCPGLAKIDLVQRLQHRGIKMCSFASAAILVFQYVQEFCHKACCYDDVVMIIDRLCEDEREALEEALDTYKSVVKDPAGDCGGEKAMQRLSTLHQLLRHLGTYQRMEPEQRLLAEQEMWNFHQITLEADLGCQYIETFTLMYCWQKLASPLRADALLALKCLSSKLETFPEGAQCRLLMCRIYLSLGAIGPAVEVYAGLETKHIQLDSLSHLLFPSLMPLGAYERADKLISQMNNFYRTNEREVLEYVVKTYLCGNFHKVAELFELKRCFEFSLTRSVCLLDRMWLSAFFIANYSEFEPLMKAQEPSLASVHTTDLLDNRDFLLNDLCETDHSTLKRLQKESSYTHDQGYLHMRHFMLRSLECLHGNKASELETALSSFQTNVEGKVAEFEHNKTVPVYLQMSNSLTSWLPFLSLLRGIVVQCSSFIQSLQQGKPDAVLIQSLLSSFTDCTASVRQALLIEGALECPALPQLSALIQTAHFAVLCMSCTLTVKAPRKRKAQLDLTPLRDIVNGVMELCTDCHLASVDHKLNQLTLDMEDSIDSRIGSSSEWSLEEMKGAVTRTSLLISTINNKPH